MKFLLIVAVAFCGIVKYDKNVATLFKRGSGALPAIQPITPQSQPNRSNKQSLPPIQPTKTIEIIYQKLLSRGYAKGDLFLKKKEVFKCRHADIDYVCKVQTVKNINETPMEAQVFEIIKANNLKSLATMHELLDLGIIDNKKTFVEVIDYLSPDKGWSNLADYMVRNPRLLTLDTIIVIFKQIVTGIVELHKHGITHSDLKGIPVYLILRVKRND
jgi:serine/threonine protein kinase